MAGKLLLPSVECRVGARYILFFFQTTNDFEGGHHFHNAMHVDMAYHCQSGFNYAPVYTIL